MQVDRSGWSGDGAFTEAIVTALTTMTDVVAIRVEDSPATRGDTGFLFLSNEIYVRFAVRERVVPSRILGFIPVSRRVAEYGLDLPALEVQLSAVEGIGPADYADPGMLQYLRTERIVPPYQTRGYKLVEMVRIYRAGAKPEGGDRTGQQP